MKDNKKMRVKSLIKPQNFDHEELNDELVVPFCSSGYRKTSSGTTCESGYSYNPWGGTVSSPEDNDDILI